MVLIDSLKSGQESNNLAFRTTIKEPIPAEFAAFQTPQRATSTHSSLRQFDGKATGFGTVIYHIQGFLVGNYPKRSQMQAILSLSRLLKDAETRY